MTWTDIRHHHPDVLDRLKQDYPHLQSIPLRRGGGDWVALVVSFAAAHDLTFNEAGEVLQDWLSRYRPLQMSKAA